MASSFGLAISPQGSGIVTAFWLFSPFWIAAFLAAIHFFRYRVIVTRDRIAIRSIGERLVELADVVDAAIAPRGKDLLVYLRNDRRLRFSALLQDCGHLKARIEADLRARVGCLSQSPGRLRDEARVKADGARERWVLVWGLVVLAIGVAAILLLE
jgi:hypothetical protein